MLAPDSKTLGRVKATTKLSQLPCACQDGLCQCCANIDIATLEFNQKACARLTFLRDTLGVKADVQVNGVTLFQNEVSG